MRYAVSYNAVSKVILGLFGIGPSRSWVEVRPEEIHARMGWAGNVTIPREDIATIQRVDHAPWWLGYGVHGMFGTWAFNGAIVGAVKITMHRPARGTVMFIPIRPRTIYLSLETPDEFLYEASTR